VAEPIVVDGRPGIFKRGVELLDSPEEKHWTAYHA
jgi:hypothetical protein